MKNPNKICILTEARTGSNLLQEILLNTDKIEVLGEIFNKGVHNKYRKGMTNDEIFSHYLLTDIIGEYRYRCFKLFYTQFSIEEFERLFQLDNIKYIYLKRNNSLRRFVSLKLAEKTNQWLVTNGRNIKKDRIYISFEELLNNLKLYEDINDFYLDNLNDKKVLNLTYEELNANLFKKSLEIFRFLGLTYPSNIRIGIKRQNPEPLNKLILNYNEIETKLKKTKYKKFLYEN
jgi:LPS sulfotransferase NodH